MGRVGAGPFGQVTVAVPSDVDDRNRSREATLRVFDAAQRFAEGCGYCTSFSNAVRSAHATPAEGRVALARCYELADRGDQVSEIAASLLERVIALDDVWVAEK